MLTAEHITHFTMMRYLNPNSVPERHHPDQHILFIVDIDCPDVKQYLEQVCYAIT